MSAPRRPLVFVARPFGNRQLGHVLDAAAQISANSVELVHGPLNGSDSLLRRLQDDLFHAERVVAFVDEANVQVAFEVGIALGAGRPLILACWQGKHPEWLDRGPLASVTHVHACSAGAVCDLVTGDHPTYLLQTTPELPRSGPELVLCPAEGEGSAYRLHLPGGSPMELDELAHVGTNGGTHLDALTTFARLTWVLTAPADDGPGDGSINANNALVAGWMCARAWRSGLPGSGCLRIFSSPEVRSLGDFQALVRKVGPEELGHALEGEIRHDPVPWGDEPAPKWVSAGWLAIAAGVVLAAVLALVWWQSRPVWDPGGPRQLRAILEAEQLVSAPSLGFQVWAGDVVRCRSSGSPPGVADCSGEAPPDPFLRSSACLPSLTTDLQTITWSGANGGTDPSATLGELFPALPAALAAAPLLATSVMGGRLVTIPRGQDWSAWSPNCLERWRANVRSEEEQRTMRWVQKVYIADRLGVRVTLGSDGLEGLADIMRRVVASGPKIEVGHAKDGVVELWLDGTLILGWQTREVLADSPENAEWP